jgi:hypothetical protein
MASSLVQFANVDPTDATIGEAIDSGLFLPCFVAKELLNLARAGCAMSG